MDHFKGGAPQWSAFFRVEGASEKRREEWLRLQPRRRKMAAFSVVLIVLGFVFQLLGELLSLRVWPKICCVISVRYDLLARLARNPRMTKNFKVTSVTP